MGEFKISQNELNKAKSFFLNGNIKTLTAQSKKINKSQPNFTGVVLALEKHGLDIIKVEDLLESIFIVYYAQTEVRKKSIKQISIGQIMKNIKWFEEFVQYYNKEKNYGTADLSAIKFLRDDIVLNFALETLRNMFGSPGKIPKEVLFSYFALLKEIEMEAEKQ